MSESEKREDSSYERRIAASWPSEARAGGAKNAPGAILWAIASGTAGGYACGLAIDRFEEAGALSLWALGAIAPPFVAALFNAFGSEVKLIAQYVVFQLALLGVVATLFFVVIGLSALARAAGRRGSASRPQQPPWADSIGDDLKARKELVGLCRKRERIANARYDAGAGPLEDVLRAKAVRLKAEIDFLREEASTRRLMIAARR